ncbi:hypothetical protein [Metabacillus bambusae]|uniref:Integrase SAM-like N-terminal domain-containing protein n=1 Tax=Metabacillus bambusae TaxID=2795218 RepID=A0ABS3N7C3_9BACI|nr:hypothetical protein [Metabacillus bambusae]MBO1514185.1 hypothetical protein [Metabacillus bambusae]
MQFIEPKKRVEKKAEWRVSENTKLNCKYTQYAITILRTYFNFCMPYKTFGELETPAQRI